MSDSATEGLLGAVKTQDRQALIAVLSGLEFETDNMQGLTGTLLHWLGERAAPVGSCRNNKLITFINPHVYNLSMQNSDVRQCLQQADRVCIDGVGIKLALLLLKRQRFPRLVAEHLFNNLIKQLDRPVSALIIGAEPSAAAAAGKALSSFNANLKVVDTLDGFADLERCCQFIRENDSVSLILVGAGTPKSEQIALMANDICQSTVIFHMGAGTLKTWAGSKRRGPALMSSLGLEWLHRIVYEQHTRARYTVGALTFARNLLTGGNLASPSPSPSPSPSSSSTAIDNRDES